MFRTKFFQAYGFWHWGEGLQTVLFTWYMTFHAGMSASEIGFFQALVLSPFLLFTVAGGALTDRIGAGRCYLWSTLGFAGVLAGYGLMDHAFGVLPWAFFAFCLLAGITSAVSNPAIDTFIPAASPRSVQANALLAATAHNVAKLAGTLTGLALPWLLALGGFGLNALLMVMSVALLSLHLRMLAAQRGGPKEGQATRPPPVFSRLRAHYRDCAENTDILLSSAMLGLLVVPAGYILWPLLLRERFPEFGGMLALLYIFAWLGAIGVTGLAGRYAARLQWPGRLALFVWLGWAIVLALLSQVQSFWQMCLLTGVLGSVKIGKALVYGRYLYNSPSESRGVLIAMDQTAFWGLATFGTFLMGLAAEQLGVTTSILLISCLVVLFVLLLVARRNLDGIRPV